MFSGQTGKTATIPQALYETCAIFRKHLDDCDATLLALGSPSIYPTIFRPSMLNNSVFAHSTLFSAQYASALTWIACGIRPARLIGHSLGQLTALCVSGVLSLYDTLLLVTSRARLIEEIWKGDPGSMIAVEAYQDKLSDLLVRHAELGLDVACYNGAQSVVLAGNTSSIDSLEASIKATTESYRYKRLQVPNTFHSALAEPLLGPLQKIAEKLHFQEPKFPLETCSKDSFWPSVTPSRITPCIRDPVYFYQAVGRISDKLDPCVWMEVGSGSSVSMLRRALEPQASSHYIKSLKFDSASLAGLPDVTAELWQLGLKVQFWPFHQDQRHQYRVLNLLPYQFDKQRHWLEWKDLAAPALGVLPTMEEKSLVQLVRKTKDEGDFEIDTQFESWQALCSKNRTLGMRTCPISLLLDLVYQAIDLVQEIRTQKGHFYDVECLETPSLIPTGTGERLSLKIIGGNSSPQSWDFR